VNILAIDTALGACSVALSDGSRLVAHRQEIMARGHAEKLAPMADALMRESHTQFSAIDVLGVTTGPGTFTGQRVGLAFVRALMVALEKPAVGVTTMEAMAEGAFAASDARHCIVLSDARREEAYLGLHERGGTVLMAPEVVAYAALAERVSALPFRAAVLAGTAAERAAEALIPQGWDLSLSGVVQPDARFVAAIAARTTPSSVPPRPLYLRAPDAKLPQTP
jgi:tRNA threonylcarbamoyladenosine biosynthesis protein TsaB